MLDTPSKAPTSYSAAATQSPASTPAAVLVAIWFTSALLARYRVTA